jgi:hypothetical protein
MIILESSSLYGRFIYAAATANMVMEVAVADSHASSLCGHALLRCDMMTVQW